MSERIQIENPETSFTPAAHQQIVRLNRKRHFQHSADHSLRLKDDANLSRSTPTGRARSGRPYGRRRFTLCLACLYLSNANRGPISKHSRQRAPSSLLCRFQPLPLLPLPSSSAAGTTVYVSGTPRKGVGLGGGRRILVKI